MAIPKVSVVMITYGHENYIREAIEGVLMQQIDFSVELIIANDCSPENTDIIVNDIIATNKSTIEIVYKKHDKNIGMMANFIFALNLAKGKYVALCDGDDYWTDPLKLQKQVDFLEENQDYGICWTRYKVIDENNCFKNMIFDEDKDFITVTAENIFIKYRTMTLTCMFHKKNIENVNFNKLKYLKDNTIYLANLKEKKGKILNFESAVYRLHLGGVWSPKSKLIKKYENLMTINEIIEKIVKNKSLVKIRKQGLENFTKILIASDELSTTYKGVYNKLFFVVLNNTSFKNRLRYLKYFFLINIK